MGSITPTPALYHSIQPGRRVAPINPVSSALTSLEDTGPF